MVKYPKIKVRLRRITGPDGNAFVILAAVKKGLEQAGIPETEIAEWQKDATSDDYDHLLKVCREWVDLKFGRC